MYLFNVSLFGFAVVITRERVPAAQFFNRVGPGCIAFDLPFISIMLENERRSVR